MSFPPKRLAAVFYLPLDAVHVGLVGLVAEAGSTEVKAIADINGVVDCRWAGLYSEAHLISSTFYCILVISFWQSEFLNVMEGNKAALGGASSVEETFRRACETLNPEFAFIATHLDQATQEWIVGLEWSVLNHEANRLATQGLGLVYFSPEMNDHWTPGPLQQDRDSLSVSRGRLMFAGRGSSRWFG